MRTITDKQIQQLINTLAEFPAKHVFNDISMLQNLPVIEEKTKTKK